jgi:hypothetical protein
MAKPQPPQFVEILPSGPLSARGIARLDKIVTGSGDSSLYQREPVSYRVTWNGHTLDVPARFAVLMPEGQQ